MLSSTTKRKNREYLVCFDFDDTITDGHVYKHLRDLKVKIGNALFYFADCWETIKLKNPEGIKKAIQLALKNGHKVAITSFTLYLEIIPPYLQKLGLRDEEIAHIKIIGGFPSKRKLNTIQYRSFRDIDASYGKSLHIDEAIKQFGIKHKNIILVDDSQENIKICEKDGFIGIKVPNNEEESQDINYLQKLCDYVSMPVKRLKNHKRSLSDDSDLIAQLERLVLNLESSNQEDICEQSLRRERGMQALRAKGQHPNKNNEISTKANSKAQYKKGIH